MGTVTIENNHHILVEESYSPRAAGEGTTRKSDDGTLQLAMETLKSKNVSFLETCVVRLTEHCNDYTDEEYYACWYSPQEFDEMQQEIHSALHAMERNKQFDEMNTTSRGLETQTTKGRRRKLRSRSTAFDAVVGVGLKKQQKSNEASVAKTYKKCTSASSLSAYLSGLDDQMSVQDLDMSLADIEIMKKKGCRRHGFSFHSR